MRQIPDTPRVGLVLGAGAARGWAHIGALEVLLEADIPIDVICGCSAGAMVAASYAGGRLDAFKHITETMTRSKLLGYLDVGLAGGGLIEGRAVMDFFRENVGDVHIDELACRFGCVAAEYGTGRETWFTSGSVVDAVRASIAMPGLVTPIRLGGRWLLDGAIVNPLPVTLCRALGADIIIAVNLSGDLMSGGQAVRVPEAEQEEDAEDGTISAWMTRLSGALSLTKRFDQALPPLTQGTDKRPGYLDVVGDALFTMQNFITRVRLAADPPDLVITPQIDDIGLMDFHCGSETIARGRTAAQERLTDLRQLVKVGG